jgi:putative nucleotidyltransferase with HDIG domain
MVLASIAGLVAVRLLPSPRGALGVAAWLLAVVAVTTVVLLASERLARRLLPLATLLRLSLVFPDEAPSRFAIALRASSVRRASAWARDAEERAPEAATQAEAVTTLAAAMSLHDRRTRGHCERVHALADLLANEMSLPEWDAQRLRWAALLHDIGKIAIPAEILNKPKALDEKRWALLRKHPTDGARIVEPLASWMGEWVRAVEDHHERWDGTGYPNQRAGKDISLAGRIVCVADAFDNMTMARPEGRAMSIKAARAELVQGAGWQFDPRVVRRFLDISIGRLRWTLGMSTLLAPVAALPWLRAVFAPGPGGAAAVAPALGSLAVIGGLVIAGGVAPADPASDPVAPPAVETNASTEAEADVSEASSDASSEAPAGQATVSDPRVASNDPPANTPAPDPPSSPSTPPGDDPGLPVPDSPSVPVPDVPSLPGPSLPAPTLPAPTLPAPTLPAPTLPAPTLPAPTLPAPTLPAPTLPAPTLPAPTLPGPTGGLVDKVGDTVGDALDPVGGLVDTTLP